MRSIPLFLFWGLLACSGCQCCPLAESYMDMVDVVANNQPKFDRFYCPGLDLTRIGYPDWCQYPWNRWCYGDCCRDCRKQPEYVHAPIYDDSARRQNRLEPAPLKDEPQIPPLMDPSPAGDEQLKPIPDPKQLEKGDAGPGNATRIPTLPPPPPVPDLPK